MKKKKTAPAGYHPQASGSTKLYLVRHKEHDETTVNGVNKYDAVTAAARVWGVTWSSVARECEFIVLADEAEK